ncbi:MAG: 4-hydroxy-tetrahydrodipicolinate synthase, partial [Pseudobdellovibrio sp.]
MTSHNYKGAISALATPFLNKSVDYESLKKLVEFQLKNGINGFVVNGTTAESPTLTWAEVEKMYSLVREIAGTRVPVILGTGSNSTDDTIEKTQKAQQMGADAALVVVPYYNKPPQRGLEAHFKAVAESADIPVILYNVPGRTITSMNLETTVALSKVKNIFAIKEASGDIYFDEK